MRNQEKCVEFGAPLGEKDTEKQTQGCRHTNPDICAKNSLPAVCAFVRSDGICLAPSRAWAAQYRKLSKK